MISGADVNLLSKQGHTVTYLACSRSPLGNIGKNQKDLCLQHILSKEPLLSLSETQKALKTAVDNGFIQVTDVLLQYGIKPTFDTVKQGCIVKKNCILAEHLLKFYNNQEGIGRIVMDLLVYTSSKWTIDHSAEERKLHEVARELLKSSRSLDNITHNVVYPSQDTSLNPFTSPQGCLKEYGWVYLAMMYGKLSIGKMLRMAGCDIKIPPPISTQGNSTNRPIGVQSHLLWILNEPLQLRQISRKKIRENVGSNVKKALQILCKNLADDISSYLAMSDLDRVDAFDLSVRSTCELSMDQTYTARETSKAAMAQTMWVYP